jgi:hypothetical protein
VNMNKQSQNCNSLQQHIQAFIEEVV